MSLAGDNSPRVVGQEEADGLVRMDCPHCGQTERRIHTGLNWCEVTGESFFLVAIERTYSEDD